MTRIAHESKNQDGRGGYVETKLKWAERVPQNLIRRLYENDAKNIQDNELIDEVGYGLYVRAHGSRPR